jgi:hypothetical protein
MIIKKNKSNNDDDKVTFCACDNDKSARELLKSF